MARDARSAKRRSLANAAITTVALLVGLVLLNVAFERVRTRFDLTSAGFFSLTTASERMVSSLDEKVQVTAYFGKIPSENAYDQEAVESLLDAYADASGGKLAWRKIDPFSRGREFQTQLAKDHGIDKLMWTSMVDGAPQRIPVYFHVKFTYLDKTEVWVPPARFSLEGLEYEFSSIIKRIAFPKRKVAVTKGFGSPDQPQAIPGFLSGQYEATVVDLLDPALDLLTYDALIVNGPSQPLDALAVRAIDQFVMAGRPTLFLMRGMEFKQQNNQQAGMPPELMPQTPMPVVGMPTQSGLEPLLAHYGVAVVPGVLLDPRGTVGGVVIQGEILPTRDLFPLAQVLSDDRYSPLGALGIVPMAYASRVELISGFDASKVKATALTRTSPSSFELTSPLALMREMRLPETGDRGPFTTAYALTGTFSSYAAAQPNADPSLVAESPPHTRILVFGSAYFVDDEFLLLQRRSPMFQRLGMAGAMLVNMVDWLVQDQALVAARSKRAPMPIEAPSADAMRWYKWGNSAGMAGLILLIGGASWFVRERRRRSLRL